MRILIAIAVLSLAPICKADSLDVLSGTLTGIPGEMLAYNLTVRTTLDDPFLGVANALMNGTVVETSTSGLVGINNFVNDGFGFAMTGTALLAEFGVWSNPPLYGPPPVLVTGYEFVDSATGASIVFVDPPVTTTPEVSAWLMLIVGLIVMAIVGVLTGKIIKRRREELERVTPPVIPTKYGPVSEPARKRAALNMRDDAELLERVTKVIASELTPPETQRAIELRSIIEPIVAKGVTLSDDGMLDLLTQVQRFLQSYVDVNMAAVRDGATAEMRRRYPEAFD